MVFVKSFGKTQYIKTTSSSTADDILSAVNMSSGEAYLMHGANVVTSSFSAGGITDGSLVEVVGRMQGGHCQVPCGIFDDPKFAHEIKENCTTIRKAMVQISELHKSGGSALDFNQMVRWVNVKEKHAEKIITAVAEYALCQRVKPKGVFASEKDYIDALKAHHHLMQAAMRAKQNVDLSIADELEHAADDCCKMYLK